MVAHCAGKTGSTSQRLKAATMVNGPSGWAGATGHVRSALKEESDSFPWKEDRFGALKEMPWDHVTPRCGPAVRAPMCVRSAGPLCPSVAQGPDKVLL